MFFHTIFYALFYAINMKFVSIESLKLKSQTFYAARKQGKMKLKIKIKLKKSQFSIPNQNFSFSQGITKRRNYFSTFLQKNSAGIYYIMYINILQCPIVLGIIRLWIGFWQGSRSRKSKLHLFFLMCESGYH